ncbi:MAG TPA: DUF2267 domain-containing protein [Methylomirabilota bacterium]|nr:DUF2267 domain-containing protein [Methylomirabilota bacterium]
MKAEEFYARVHELGGLESRKEGKRWSIATLGALWHLLPNAETRRHFASQLPRALKSALLDEPPRALLMDRDAFVQHVGAALGVHAPDGARALRIVYQVLREALSPGQIDELEAHIPKDVAALLQREPAA